MTSVDNGETEIQNNKHLFYNRMLEDGKLVSPIDLCLETAHQLRLDNLKWTHIDDPPVKMKLTNTGETVIVSAKWATERPYLTGGPLEDSYVFSQIHFHWGSDEHEGSEHTVRGICYPMEMHVVFYKTRYLTQEGALKQDDGVIIVVYLMKLADETSSGLQWLVSQLDRVVQPHSSTPLPLSPLSSLLVPFVKDYLVYWGSLQTSRCAHTMLWLVSRAALAITVADLNAFRSMLNARKQPMNKNFRASNAPRGRVVFHINPSSDMKNLLLSGTINPPGRVLEIRYCQVPDKSRDPAQVWRTGDSNTEKNTILCSDKKSEKDLEKNTKNKNELKTRLPCPTNTRGLQSSLVHYFSTQRPDSAQGDGGKRQSKNIPRNIPEVRRASPAKTTIPRPLGKNAGLLAGSLEVKAEPTKIPRPTATEMTKTRPVSSPNKFRKKQLPS